MCVHVCVCVCALCVYAHTHTHTCMHTHNTHTHIHTHTHTLTNTQRSKHAATTKHATSALSLSFSTCMHVCMSVYMRVCGGGECVHLTILSGSGWIVDSQTRLHTWSPAYAQIHVRDDGPPFTLHHLPASMPSLLPAPAQASLTATRHAHGPSRSNAP